MRHFAVIGLTALALLGACGGSDPSAAEVVRSWSEALNADQNDAAADLFAHGAIVVQGGTELRLADHADALAWNEALPCNGRIVELSENEDVVQATFLLRDSQTSPCDGPGQNATAVFTVREGKITRWEQLSTAPGDTV
jgi:hypothetical protein